VHCLVSLRRAHAAAHDPRWRRRRLQLSRWRQQASAQPSTSTSTVPSTKCFIYHTLGPGGSGGDRTRLKNILVRTSSTAAQPAAESSSHRRQLGAAHCDHKAQHTLSHGLAGSHDRAHSSLQLHPHRHRRLTHPLSRASLPAPPLRRACCCPRSHCPAPNQRPVAGFRFSSAHTPTPACTRLATLVPLTLIRPPSCCTTRCDAWLTRVADSSTLPTDSLACLLACFDCETLSPPLLRFRALRIPSSPSPNSGFARLHVHKRLLVLDFASLRLATLTPSRAPLIDPVTVT
jgi:hypothetical protein